MDTASYGFVKSKNYKLEFAMMDIDCQLYIPPSKKAPAGGKIVGKIDGISKLPGPTPNDTPASAGPSQAPSDLNRLPPKSFRADPRLTKPSVQPQSFSETFNEERKKRERSGSLQAFPDAAKKISASTQSLPPDTSK